MKRNIALVIFLTLVIQACDLPTQPSNETSEPSPELADAIAAKKGTTKVDVCHLTGEGEYRKINIAAPAVAAHLQHGDELAGGEVLNEDCNPVPVSCSCLSDPRVADSYIFQLDRYILLEYIQFDGSSLFFSAISGSGNITVADISISNGICDVEAVDTIDSPSPDGVMFIDLEIPIPGEEEICSSELADWAERIENEVPSVFE